MAKKQIFKLQMPLAGAPMVLIYNKDRSAQGMIPLTDELKELMGDSIKDFFYCIHREDGPIEIFEKAEWQEW